MCVRSTGLMYTHFPGTPGVGPMVPRGTSHGSIGGSVDACDLDLSGVRCGAPAFAICLASVL